MVLFRCIRGSKPLAKKIPKKKKNKTTKVRKKKKSSKDQRDQSRIPLQLEVHYRVQQNFTIDLAHDISPGGIFLQTKNPLPKGTLVELNFSNPNDPDDNRKVTAEGRVVWSSSKKVAFKNRPGMGIEFTRIDVKGQVFIDNLINDFLRKVSIY